MRLKKSFELTDSRTGQQLLAWANAFDVCCVLNSNHETMLFNDAYSSHHFIVAAGAADEIVYSENESQKNFEALKLFHESKKDWLFGFLTYDLKNDSGKPREHLESENQDSIGFAAIHFFQPRYVLEIIDRRIEISFLTELDNEHSVQEIFDEILNTAFPDEESESEINIHQKISKEEYISTVNKINQHIKRGNIYEMNYCVEFFAEDVVINPLELYRRLNEISPMPFSCFYKLNDRYLVCASPERFMARRGSKIISQPMKGTAKRGQTSTEDKQLELELKNDRKEQSENVMIVDLVRNDLSHTAKKGSVQVEELFGIYTFRQVHQMVSTVVSEMKEDASFADVIRYAFPMGSMTGAPKIRAMQLIEEFEKTKRGLYSGSVGYISPDGDFDFNVVIRSILYHAQKNRLSFMVGSAITANSIPEKEYDECMLKAKAMLDVLNSFHPATLNQS